MADRLKAGPLDLRGEERVAAFLDRDLPGHLTETIRKATIDDQVKLRSSLSPFFNIASGDLSRWLNGPCAHLQTVWDPIILASHTLLRNVEVRVGHMTLTTHSTFQPIDSAIADYSFAAKALEHYQRSAKRFLLFDPVLVWKADFVASCTETALPDTETLLANLHGHIEIVCVIGGRQHNGNRASLGLPYKFTQYNLSDSHWDDDATGRVREYEFRTRRPQQAAATRFRFSHTR